MSRSRSWQRWRKWALVLGIFALGIPLSSALFVRSSGSRSRLHELATNAIRDELGLRATIGSVQLQLVPFSIVASDITLDDPVYGRFAEADELRIQPSFRTLLRGGLDIDVITIRGADLRLVVRNGQIRNLPRAGEPPTGGGPPTLPFDELHVLDSTLTVDAEPHASGQLRHVDLHVSGTDGGIRIDAASRNGWVRHRGGTETIQLLDGSVEITEDELRVPRLSLRTPDLELSVREGAAPIPFAEQGYEGRVELRYDLAHIGRLPLPPEVTLPAFSGHVTLDARFFTEDDLQHASGTVDLEEAHIDQWGLGQSTHVVFTADRREAHILEGSVANLPLRGGHVELGGTIHLDPDRGFPLDVTARVVDLSFARLMMDLGVTDNAIVEWFFGGTLRLAGTLAPLALEGPVHLQTRDFRVSKNPWHEDHVERVISITHGDFDGRWSIRPDAVRFSDLVGVLPRSRIRGDVLLGFDNLLRVSANAEVADLHDISPLDQFALGGVGSARCEIDGTFQDPRVIGHVQMNDFVFDEFRLGSIEGDALLDPDGLGVHFAMMSAVKNESHYRVEDLYLDFHRNRFELTGLLHLDGMLLADFYHVFGFEEDERFTSYQGLARGEAQLHYTNGFPEDSPTGTLDVDMNVGLDWATLDGYRFVDGRVVGRWRWLDWSRGARGAELTIAHASLRKGQGTLTVDGRMSLGGNLRFDAVADRLSLSELEGIGDRMPGIEGVASAIGRIGGTVEIMHADFDVGVTNVTYDGRPMGDGRFFVRLTDRDDPYVVEARPWDRDDLPTEPCAGSRFGLAHADWPADPPISTVDGPEERLVRPMAFLICGSGLDDRLNVDLAVGRTEQLPVRGTLRLDNLDLGPLFSRTPDGQRVQGGVSGTLAFRGGALRRPETLSGSVTLTNVRVAQADLEIRNDRSIDMVFDDGVLVIDKARFVGPDSRLRVRGRASLEDGLALQVNGDVDLGIVARLTRTVTEASGRVRARLNVTGDFADPELYGQATVERGSFRFASFDSPVENLAGRIQFSQRSILFEGFGADVAGGHIDASGSAELREQEIERYAFEVDGSDLVYDFAEGVDANFGGRAHLTWSRGERLPLLSGELRVNRFAYTRPIELRSLGDMAATAVRGAFRETRTEVRRYDPDQDLVAIDLRVAQRAPFRIQNNLIDAEVRIETGDRPFRIVGTDQRFGVQGAMAITRGNIFFQSNEFTVRRGTIQFDDTTRIDPHLNVEAVTEIRRSSDLSAPSWRIWLNLIGSSENLRLVTRSEPDLPEPDILMLLAFGMTRAEMQQLQQGGSELLSTAALEALASVTGVDREVRRALPLIDDIRLTTGYSYRTGRSEPRLSIGKRIAERVRLSATTGLGEGREFRGALDWQLDDNQRLGVSYDNYNISGTNSFGNLGVDWGYRLEFE